MYDRPTMQENKQLKRLVGAAGGQTAVARELGVKQPTLHNRLNKGTYDRAWRDLHKLRAALSTLLEREVGVAELFPLVLPPDTPEARA